MKTRTELIKPCPFCGFKYVDIARTNPEACWVECCRCYAQTKHHATRKGAIRNWNRRRVSDGTASINWDMDRDDNPQPARTK